MTQEQDRFAVAGAVEIDLEMVAVLLGAMEMGMAAELGESLSEDGSDAVSAGFIVARGFDLDEFTDDFEQGVLAGFEIVQAIKNDVRFGLGVSGSFHN